MGARSGKKWSKDETAKLTRLVSTKGKNWCEIAIELNTGRTASAVQQKWRHMIDTQKKQENQQKLTNNNNNNNNSDNNNNVVETEEGEN